MMRMLLPALAGLTVASAAPAAGPVIQTAAPLSAARAAAAFGARPAVEDIAISPDGKHAVYITPGAGQVTAAFVADLATGELTQVQAADGKPLKLASCGWSANDRIVCLLYGVTSLNGTHLSYTRLVAFDADGRHPLALGRRGTGDALRISQYDGGIIDWLAGDDGTVLMMRDYVPEQTTGTLIANERDGMGVDRIDTRTGQGSRVETPNRSANGYISDGRGNVRIMRLRRSDSDTGALKGVAVYMYRPTGDKRWRAFSQIGEDERGLRPIAVDGQANVAYALQKQDGRDALYRVALDGSLKAELVFANPDVDVDDVVTIGRGGRVIGASYVTDRRNVAYFDADYRKLAAALSRAIPKLPLIHFAGASTDEQRLLLFAGSDVDPGRYYVFDRATHHLAELAPARPQLEGVRLAAVTSITYPASDGTRIPAYLTLPPGSDGKGLPALVMPHGGPASRDEWGFDFLAQYFAQRGFAVLQPEYRGSAGYGDDWAKANAFKAWRLAIGDVADAGRWLVASGTAAPAMLAIFGWSYGGYAALQANVIAPDLFKAAVAVAPVTDFGMLKEEARGFTNFALVSAYIGAGTIVSDGSPARHADAFKAPVLMFHGDQDINVGVAESRAMDGALRHAGKKSELIVYPGLDHQLDDAAARTDLLTRSDAFLRATLGM